MMLEHPASFVVVETSLSLTPWAFRNDYFTFHVDDSRSNLYIIQNPQSHLKFKQKPYINPVSLQPTH